MLTGFSVAELKAEIEELQKVIFSDTATEKEKADANIKLEKAMAAFEQTPEAREETRKRKEERRFRNEPLNRAALVRMKEVQCLYCDLHSYLKARYQLYRPDTIREQPELLKRVGENPELRLLFMEAETILRLHQVRCYCC